jgi:hypothetical protein
MRLVHGEGALVVEVREAGVGCFEHALVKVGGGEEVVLRTWTRACSSRSERGHVQVGVNEGMFK